MKNYTLCFRLNEILQLEFSRQADHEIVQKEKTLKTTFAVFGAEHPLLQTEFFLFSNKQGQEALLPEAAMFDFLLKISGSYKDTKALVAAIKKMEDVLAVTEIPAKTIRQVDRLLYEIPKEATARLPRKKIRP